MNQYNIESSLNYNKYINTTLMKVVLPYYSIELYFYLSGSPGIKDADIT